jgi:hypothetical protein
MSQEDLLQLLLFESILHSIFSFPSFDAFCSANMSGETVLSFEAVYTTTSCSSHFIISNMPPVSGIHMMRSLIIFV